MMIDQKSATDVEIEGEEKEVAMKVSLVPKTLFYFAYFLLVLILFSMVFSIIKVMSD